MNRKRSLFCKRWEGNVCVEVDIDAVMHHLRTEHYDILADLADETKEHNVEAAIFFCETEPGKLTPTRLQLGDEESIEISDCPSTRGVAVAIHTHKCWERGVVADPSPADMIASYFNPEWDVLGTICPKTRDDEGWVDFVLVSDFHNLPPRFKEKVDRLLEPWIEENEVDIARMYENSPCDLLDASIILKRFSKFRFWRFWEAQMAGRAKINIPEDQEKITEYVLEKECYEKEGVCKIRRGEFPESWTPKMVEAAKNWCESLGIPIDKCAEKAEKMIESMRKAFED